MSLHRFFLDASLAREEGVSAQAGVTSGAAIRLPLSPSDAHHLTRVLRLRPGDRVAVVEPEGIAYEVRIVRLEGVRVFGEVLETVARPRKPRVVLFHGIGKGSKTDLVVRETTELGVEGVVPIVTARCVVRFDARKRADRGARWRRVAEEASKQSQRDTIPQVQDPTDFDRALERLEEFDRVVVMWERAIGAGMRSALSGVAAESDVAVVVGPEGGFAESEIDALVGVGAVPVTLGDTILRTETAGVVAVALAVYELGGLGGTR